MGSIALMMADRTPTDPDPPRPIPDPTSEHSTVAESDPPTGRVHHDTRVDLPPGSVVDEIYEIDAKLGAGAMGEVYAARHMKLGKRVAIKVISPRLSEDAGAIERFALEARTLAQIQHPAIVAVDHVGELADGRAFFSMEFLLGETLFERLQRGRIPLIEALRILDQMARGLDAAHGSGVTHRDLKPENTFLVHLAGEAPIVKLVDFGLAKLVGDVDRRAERTQSGVAIGTPMYMSPEQARGIDVDHRTDVYALGCVAYELLLGTTPFPHAQSAPELYAAHLHETPPLPRSIWPEIPPQLDLALFAMLAKDPAYRPTLAQVRAVLVATRTATPSQRAATEFIAPRSPNTKTRTALIVAGTLISGMLIGGILTFRSNSAAPREIPVVAPSIPAPATHVMTEYIDAAIEPEAPTAPIATTPAPTAPIATTPAPHPRSTAVATPKHSSSGTPKAVNATIVVPTDLPLPDASIDSTPDPALIVDEPPPAVMPKKMVPKPKKIDRNQTMNPFAHDNDKVNP
jgi:eukaryotic-like serine/threonine-protein kinase